MVVRLFFFPTISRCTTFSYFFSRFFFRFAIESSKKVRRFLFESFPRLDYQGRAFSDSDLQAGALSGEGQVGFASKVITLFTSKIQSFTSVVIIVISHGKLETPTGGFSLGNSTSNLGAFGDPDGNHQDP